MCATAASVASRGRPCPQRVDEAVRAIAARQRQAEGVLRMCLVMVGAQCLLQCCSILGGYSFATRRAAAPPGFPREKSTRQRGEYPRALMPKVPDNGSCLDRTLPGG